MNTITKVIEVDIYEANAIYVRANQANKKSRYLSLQLTQHGEPYEIPNGVIARLQGKRPNEEPILNDGTIEGNTIIFELTEYMLAVSGTADVEVALYDEANNALITSSSFHLIIPSSPLDAFKIVNASEFTTLVNALNKVDQIISDGNNAVNTFEQIKVQWKEMNKTGTQLVTDLNQIKLDTLTAKDETIAATNQSNQTNQRIQISEQERVQAENIRIENENVRIENERNRISGFESIQSTFNEKVSEIDNTITTANKAIQNANIATEEAIQAKEAIITTNESVKTEELKRVTEEELRKQSELQRQTNESQRQQNFTQKINEINVATETANIATQNADMATIRANKAAEVCEGISDQTGLVLTIEKGQPNGVATLDTSGKIPSTQLPSYVDDVLEINTYEELPKTGETGKIYVITTDSLSSGHRANEQYRWSGSQYIRLNSNIKTVKSETEPEDLFENDIWEKIL